MNFSNKAFCTAFLMISFTVCQAQQVRLIRSQPGDVRRTEQVALITNQATGEKITMEKYGELSKTDPFAYHLVPTYNEFGDPTAYLMRPSTPEEHETHRFRDRDPAKQPKAGQVMAPFVMTGLDDNVYRSSGMIGKVVVLNFLVGLDKTLWSDQQNEELTTILKPYQGQNGLIALGVLNSEQAKPGKAVKQHPWPFIPVPNGYGFHNKYHITSVPTFVVIDKTGRVAATVQGAGSAEKLKQILAEVIR
ncbi:TlpA family protein disulfide reductase [Spirosoma aerophilum]